MGVRSFVASYHFDPLNGIIIPDTSTTLAQVQAEYKDAFGEDLIVRYAARRAH